MQSLYDEKRREPNKQGRILQAELGALLSRTFSYYVNRGFDLHEIAQIAMDEVRDWRDLEIKDLQMQADLEKNQLKEKEAAA